MMYNNGFPVGYPAIGGYPGYQQPYTTPYPPAQQPAPQMLTPPTIRAEIVQVDDLAQVHNTPVAVGTSQMFMAKDDSFIAIKSVLANGEQPIALYPRKDPEPAPAPIDPANVVTWDKLEEWAASRQSAPRSRAKREEAET